MGIYNKKIGNYGENLCVEYLTEKGYKIIHRNFRCKLGEIDIISKPNRDSCICFAEVKSRYNNFFGIPCEAVNSTKIRKIKSVAEFYIIKNNLKDYSFRFDVLEVIFNNKDDSYSINLIENAF